MTAYRTWKLWQAEPPQNGVPPRPIRNFEIFRLGDGWLARITERPYGQNYVATVLAEGGDTSESACAALLERAKRPLIEVSER